MLLLSSQLLGVRASLQSVFSLLKKQRIPTGCARVTFVTARRAGNAGCLEAVESHTWWRLGTGGLSSPMASSSPSIQVTQIFTPLFGCLRRLGSGQTSQLRQSSVQSSCAGILSMMDKLVWPRRVFKMPISAACGFRVHGERALPKECLTGAVVEAIRLSLAFVPGDDAGCFLCCLLSAFSSQALNI